VIEVLDSWYCQAMVSPNTLQRAAVVASLVVAAVASPACTSDGPGAEAADGDPEGGTEEPLACLDPGSPLLESTALTGGLGPSSGPVSCSGGWATDAPQLNPAWTVEIPAFRQMLAHPDGGVIVAGPGTFARYASDGEQQWNIPAAILSNTEALLTVERAGTILILSYDWNTGSSALRRYEADGSSLAPLIWPSNSGQVWGLATYEDDLIIGTVDPQNQWKTTLIRLDADGNELLRKASNQVSDGLLAINQSGTAAFGRFPTFLLSVTNGAVLGNLVPSTGFAAAAAASGDDFWLAGGAAADFFVGRYSATGTERWSQTYDRANLNDIARAIAVGLDGTMIAVGNTQLLEIDRVWWFTSQPWIVSADGDGNALWSDRIDAIGEASAVAIGQGGEVYVAGQAQGLSTGTQSPPMISWLRSYVP
jgi:outer membrane protein assembly factor BamB